MHRTHEMRMTRNAQSGLEEWACPTCGRRILLRWPPHYTKHVLDAGDEEACHIARTADDTPPAPTDAPSDAPDTTAGENRRLRETGVHALPTPAPAHLNPSEPV
ncbi:hypothetical protein [Actinomadura sp. GTD37]|uniref:hypothetical protein n=1 Tax=Actinomadura sp. GTD37 TaxID=1778030 RepID=UPI0035C004DB